MSGIAGQKPRIPRAKKTIHDKIKTTTITELLERDKKLQLRAKATKKVLVNLKLRDYEKIIEHAERWDCDVSEAIRTLIAKGIEQNRQWGSEADMDPTRVGRMTPQEAYVHPIYNRPVNTPIVFRPTPTHTPAPYVPGYDARISRDVETVWGNAPSTLIFPNGATVARPEGEEAVPSEPPTPPEWDEELC